MHPTRSERAVRAVGAASISTFVALFSHVAGGGTMPGFAGIAVPLALATLACLAIGDRRHSLLRLSISVVISQLLFHFLFVLGATGPASTRMPSGDWMRGAARARAESFGTPAAVAACDPLMWAAHGFAAVGTIAALHHGARVADRLGQLRERIRTTLLHPLCISAPIPLERPAQVVVRALPLVGRCRSEHDVAPLRGPPALVAS